MGRLHWSPPSIWLPLKMPLPPPPLASNLNSIDFFQPASDSPSSPPVDDCSTQLKVTTTKLRDYICNIVRVSSLATHSSSSASPTPPAFSSKSSYPLYHYINCDKFFNKHKHFLAAIIVISEPTRFSDVLTDQKWRDVIKLEIDALEQNSTWKITPLPPRKCAFIASGFIISNTKRWIC